jgi:hypothetical protein
MRILLNWLLLILVLTVNTLANVLPINGMNTGQISGLYPNYFVPAGFTFGIWSVIYLLIIGYTTQVTLYEIRYQPDAATQAYINTINPYFQLTCIWNAAWILAWHYLQMTLSLLIMLAFLVTLIVLFVKAYPLTRNMQGRKQLWLWMPFTIYLGWISVATIANVTALLVKIQWGGAGIAAYHWSAIMIVVAMLLALFFVFLKQVKAPALVIAWALWGIHASQGPRLALLDKLTTLGIVLILLSVGFTWINSYRLQQKNSR